MDRNNIFFRLGFDGALKREEPFQMYGKQEHQDSYNAGYAYGQKFVARLKDGLSLFEFKNNTVIFQLEDSDGRPLEY